MPCSQPLEEDGVLERLKGLVRWVDGVGLGGGAERPKVKPQENPGGFVGSEEREAFGEREARGK